MVISSGQRVRGAHDFHQAFFDSGMNDVANRSVLKQIANIAHFRITVSTGWS